MMNTVNNVNLMMALAGCVLAGVGVKLTFIAYYDGVAGRVHDLKAHCRLIGCIILTLMLSGIFTGADIAVRCSARAAEALARQAETRAENMALIDELAANNRPVWTIRNTQTGTEITATDNGIKYYGVRNRTSGSSERGNGSGNFTTSGRTGYSGSDF